MILDTNALTALVDGDPDIEPVLRATVTPLSIPVIVIGEYRYGIAESKFRRRYEAWLAEHLRDFDVLEVTEATSTSYALVRSQLKAAGTPIPANDAWIAALARQHHVRIASRDRHFDAVPGIERQSW